VTTPTMVGLRPFWGRVTVLPSPVDEIQRDSGVIVPITGAWDDEGTRPFERGIVLHVAACGVPAEAALPEGSVVYYESGDRIGDVVVVKFQDIVAFMEDGS
jgi:hypothetical protein